MRIENYKPDYYLEAVYQLDAVTLQKLDVNLLLVDLDNTLIAWNNPDGTAEMRDWLLLMKQANIRVVVVSNNNYKRVKRAVERFDIDFIPDAMKPFTKGIKIALQRYSTPAAKSMFVGDQRMTDIRAAKRAGIRSVLVKPLLESDHWPTKINRARERRVNKKLERKYGVPIYKKRLEK